MHKTKSIGTWVSSAHRRTRFATVAIATMLAGLAANAQDLSGEDVLVRAPRHVGRSPIGAAIEDVTAVRRVSFHGLDLRSPAGIDALNKRVARAAHAECQELERAYPIGEPDAMHCAKVAIEQAQPAIRRAVSAASAAR